MHSLGQVLHCQMQWPLVFFQNAVSRPPNHTFQKDLTYDVESVNVAMEKKFCTSSHKPPFWALFQLAFGAATCGVGQFRACCQIFVDGI